MRRASRANSPAWQAERSGAALDGWRECDPEEPWHGRSLLLLGWLAEQGTLLQQDMPSGATTRQSASAKAQERRAQASPDFG